MTTKPKIVYVCVDTGDADILGVYEHKETASSFAESLAPAYRIQVIETEFCAEKPNTGAEK